MKTMKYYHELYLKCDILLLDDVLKKLINNSVKNYGLCPSYYLSAPVLSWNAMLKMTKIKFELIKVLTCTCSLKRHKKWNFLYF